MRALLYAAVCPVGVGVATLVDRKTFRPLIGTVFPVPDDHCEGCSATPPLAKVMTSAGAAGPIPQRTTTPPPLGPVPVHPPAPTVPPLVYPLPPPVQSNSLLGRYQSIAEAAVQRGADAQTAMNTLRGAGGGNPAMTSIINGFPGLGAVTATAPLAMADYDQAAMRAYINLPGTTTNAVFAGGSFTAIFDPVDPSTPCGEWTLVTLYPNPP